jgi:ParD-like antitoxin of type II ParDE toxin-antitoxin system
MKEGMTRLTIDIPTDIHTKLKALSALERKSIKQLLMPMIESKLDALRFKSTPKKD